MVPHLDTKGLNLCSQIKFLNQSEIKQKNFAIFESDRERNYQKLNHN